MARPRSEHGLSLVEVIIAITILGLVIVAMVGGMTTSIVVSEEHRDQASGDTIARSIAERIKSNGVNYIECAGVGGNPTYSAPAPAGFTPSIQVAFWDGTSTSPAVFGSSPSCPDAGVQRVTIRVESAGGSAETLQIVKRRR